MTGEPPMEPLAAALAEALWAWGFDATGPVLRDEVLNPTDGQKRMARKLAGHAVVQGVLATARAEAIVQERERLAAVVRTPGPRPWTPKHEHDRGWHEKCPSCWAARLFEALQGADR